MRNWRSFTDEFFLFLAICNTPKAFTNVRIVGLHTALSGSSRVWLTLAPRKKFGLGNAKELKYTYSSV